MGLINAFKAFYRELFSKPLPQQVSKEQKKQDEKGDPSHLLLLAKLQYAGDWSIFKRGYFRAIATAISGLLSEKSMQIVMNALKS